MEPQHDTDRQDVVDLLLAQHDEIKLLFAQVANTTGDRKRELFQDLVRLLAVHEAAEEQLVHPLARGKLDSGASVVDSRLKEEDEAKHALARLYDLGVEHPRFDAELIALGDSVKAHADAEENEEFRHLRDTVDADQLRTLAKAVKAAQATAPTRPHPAAGESAVGNMLAGPPLAVFDRVRDAIRDVRQS